MNTTKTETVTETVVTDEYIAPPKPFGRLIFLILAMVVLPLVAAALIFVSQEETRDDFDWS